MWLPRERHAVAVLDPNGALATPARDPTMYVSGGIMRIQEQRCGEMMCGGGYRKWANDVWPVLPYTAAPRLLCLFTPPPPHATR